MSKITMLTQFFPPETNAAANRIGVMADVLAREHEITVIALKPSYPTPGLFSALSLTKIDAGRSYSIKRTLHFKPHNESLIKRGISEHRMAIRLAAAAFSEPADAIIVSSPSMFLAPVGWMLARLKGARFMWDVRDVTWKYPKESVKTSSIKRIIIDLLERYMRFVLRRSDLVIAATSGIAATLTQQYINDKKLVMVPNGISKELLDMFGGIEEPQNGRRPVVAYVGLLGYNQGIDVLLDVASRLPGIDLLLVGDGPERQALEDRVNSGELRNISFTVYLSREKILEIYKKSDILFAQLKDTPTLNSTGLPSKLFEYMATGRPFIYAGKGLATEFLNDVGCALTVVPEDPDAITNAITSLLDDPALMQELGSKGREFVQQNYHREQLMEQLLRELKDRFSL